MNEENEVFMIVYDSDAGECLSTHIRFVQSMEEGQAVLHRVQERDEGHLLLIEGRIVMETKVPSWRSL